MQTIKTFSMIALLYFIAINFELINCGEVFLYAHGFYKGHKRNVYLTKRCYEVDGRMGNEVSSLDVGQNCVEIYETYDCTGEFKTIDGITRNVFYRVSDNLESMGMNDKVRSMKLCP